MSVPAHIVDQMSAMYAKRLPDGLATEEDVAKALVAAASDSSDNLRFTVGPGFGEKCPYAEGDVGVDAVRVLDSEVYRCGPEESCATGTILSRPSTSTIASRSPSCCLQL
jgi:hypothetical protein